MVKNCYIQFRDRRLSYLYRGAAKSLARPTSRCILFDGENISFDASLVIYINSTNILFYCCTVHFDNTEILISNKCTPLLHI